MEIPPAQLNVEAHPFFKEPDNSSLFLCLSPPISLESF